MSPLFQAGLEFQQFLKKKQWPFCFIGGLAVIRWGGVRMTQDIDLSLLTGFGSEEKYIKGNLSAPSPRCFQFCFDEQGFVDIGIKWGGC